jgi:anti-sigma regulatory factor (Ser/Thr protein kinase)
VGSTDEREFSYEFSRQAGKPALSQVRAWIRDRLTSERPTAVYDTQLAATELVTNAYEHARGAIVLRLRLIRERAVLRLEVEDGSPDLPPRQPSTPDVGQIRGRGLLLINALSSAWGVRRAPGSKTVWVEIALA